jgi:thiosulfate/3-mercaptopyruvate sulfurtransferase
MTLPLLIEPEQLQPLLQQDSLLVVDCSSQQQFERGHIPGSVHLAPAKLQCGIKPATGKLPDRQALTRLFRELGLRPGQHVVAADDEGGGWAGRLIWTLDCIGHPHYSLLNGGLAAWIGEGYPLEHGVAAATPGSYTVEAINPEPIAQLQDILARLGNGDMAIWDARSAEEFAGTRVLAQRGGHIPGAVHLEWTDLMDPGRHLRLLPLAQIEAMLQQRGLTPDKHIVTHCQTHHRSGLSYVVAKLLGYTRIQGYDGSWSEWGNRDDTPIASG